MIELTDTHCHIHEADFTVLADDQTHKLWNKLDNPNPDAMITRAVQHGVSRMICVGVTQQDSAHAVEFVQNRPNCWASIGIHPHEANGGQKALDALAGLARMNPADPAPQYPHKNFMTSKKSFAGSPLGVTPGFASSIHSQSSEAVGDAKGGVPQSRAARYLLASMSGEGYLSGRTCGVARADKIVAIGEIGLDYFYSHSTKEEQIKALRFQIELALEHNLPIIFHVREAFDDFWPIFDSYKGIRGVLHSFTDTHANLQKALERGLYIGINGITTFTKVPHQLQTAKEVPLQKLLLETDAPFLTPRPLRGTVNEPAHVRLVAEFLAGLRAQTIEDVAANTSHNAQTLFALD
jgi:TatD DNase family protein